LIPKNSIDTDASVEPADQAGQNLGAELNNWVLRLRRVAAAALDVVALEARLAALSLATVLFLAVASALLLVTGWLALCGAGLVWLVDRGWSWPASLLLGALSNSVLALLAWLGVCKFSNNLCFKMLRWMLVPAGERSGENDERNTTDVAHADTGPRPAQT
jgi:hypothetical protein